MFYETDLFRKQLKTKTDYKIVMITSEFVSCFTDNEQALTSLLCHWRQHIFSNLSIEDSFICQLNKGNVMVMLEKDYLHEFRLNLESSIVTSKEQNTAVLRYHLMELEPNKAEYLLTFF